MRAVLAALVRMPGSKEEFMIEALVSLIQPLIVGENPMRDSLILSAIEDLNHAASSMRAATVLEEDGYRCFECRSGDKTVSIRTNDFPMCETCWSEASENKGE